MPRWYRIVLSYVLLTSGATAMFYEVVLIRELTLAFGATEIATGGTLAAFMAGLALGSRMLGALSDRTSNPVVLLILLELGISACALYLLPAVGLVQTLSSFSWKLFLSLALMLFPTFLMGGEIPIAAKILFEHGQTDGEDAPGMGECIGYAYSADTVGAIVGALMAGMVLIPLLGSLRTLLLGGLLEAVGAMTLFTMPESPGESSGPPVEEAV